MLRAALVDEDVRKALAFHLRQPRYEVFPSARIVDELSAHVPRDVKITVTASPRKGMLATLAVCERLARRGYRVAPHLSARLIQHDRELSPVRRNMKLEHPANLTI